MADENEAPRECPDDCAGPVLEKLRDVTKEVAAVYRLLKKGHLEPGRGHVMLTALGIQLKALQDRRDSLWTKRAEKLWEEREQRQQQQEPN